MENRRINDISLSEWNDSRVRTPVKRFVVCVWRHDAIAARRHDKNTVAKLHLSYCRDNENRVVAPLRGTRRRHRLSRLSVQCKSIISDLNVKKKINVTKLRLREPLTRGYVRLAVALAISSHKGVTAVVGIFERKKKNKELLFYLNAFYFFFLSHAVFTADNVHGKCRFLEMIFRCYLCFYVFRHEIFVRF